MTLHMNGYVNFCKAITKFGVGLPYLLTIAFWMTYNPSDFGMQSWRLSWAEMWCKFGILSH